MLECIMAEVSTPDEYQSYRMHRSDHHLPEQRLTHDHGTNTARTHPRGLISSTYSTNSVQTAKVKCPGEETRAGSEWAPLSSLADVYLSPLSKCYINYLLVK